MHEAFQPLVARVQLLGNTTRRYLRTIERGGEAFLERMEAAHVLSSIHLDQTAPSAEEDFGHVAGAARDPEERLRLLGTYYAVQLLHQNARTLERLAYDLAENTSRLASYAAFLERNEAQFAQLISIYMEQVLAIVTPQDAGPFVLLSVGSLGHQDDIDMAVVHGEEARRPDVDRAVARLGRECQRYASPLDNYFAMEVGADRFCSSIGDLDRALKAGGIGFVLVTELLRAERVVGEAAILDRLRRELTAEYHYRHGRNNDRHELYLRGLLGESRSLLLRPPPPDQLHPKDDALRLILGLTTALKTVAGVSATRPQAILREVAPGLPDLRRPLRQLEESFVFLEAFWQTAQLLVALDEEIAVEGEAARENLDRIASAMGYRDRGSVGAVEHLLVHYHEAVDNAQAAAGPVMESVAQHLTRTSRYSRWARHRPPQDLASKLAEILVAAARAFRSVRFYDDLIEAFAAPSGGVLGTFIRSYRCLPTERRAELARLYAIWGCDAPYTMMRLMTLIAGHKADGPTSGVVAEMIDAFLDQLERSPEVEPVRALSRVFRAFPALGNRFLFLLSDERLARFDRALDVGIGSAEVAAARDSYRALIGVHQRSSRYVRRVIARVTARHPVTVKTISDDQSLKTLALGQLAASERHDDPEVQKALLGDFYDIEFLRSAMRTLRGAPIAYTRAMFAELSETYLERLFDLCFRQVQRETGGWMAGRDRVGLFLSGGGARGRPYDEDFDLIALVDSDDPALRRFAERVVVLMNGQIARRGAIPQYRLGESLGRYVPSIDEVDALLSRDDDRLFVDRCQLLGSRLVVGNRDLAAQTVTRLLTPHLFDRAVPFVRRVAREIRERRGALRALPDAMLHLKDHPGGLREMDLALAAARARYLVWDTRGMDPFLELARRDAPRAEIYWRLAAINDYFVAVRSAYRVAVSATATIEREYLAAPARLLGCEGRAGASTGDALFEEIRQHLDEAAQLVDRLLLDLADAE